MSINPAFMPMTMGGFVYLLFDEFTTARAAGAVNGTAMEPGPGTRTVVDASSVITIVDGRLKWNGTGPTGTRIVSASQAPNAGQAWGWQMLVRATIDFRLWQGLATSANDLNAMVAGIRHTTASIIRVVEAGGGLFDYTLGVNEHCFVFIERVGGAGGLLFGRNGLSGNYTLLWVYSRALSNRLMQVAQLESSTAENVEMDNWRLTTLSGNYASDWGNATNRVAAPVTGEITTMPANGIVEFAWTVVAAETLDIQVRRVDDNNCWIVRLIQATGRIYLYEKVAGVETERGATGGIAQTLTAASTYRIIIRCEGNSIWTAGQNVTLAQNAVGRHAYTSASFQNTATGVKVSGFTTGANLATWATGGWSLPVPFDLITLPESSTLARVSYQTLWTGTAPADWLGRPVLLDADGVWICTYMSIPSHGPDVTAQIFIRFSTDEGATWTAANTFTNGSPVTGFPLNETVGTKALIESTMIKAPNGDLLIHAYERAGGGSSQWRSTDGGATWAHEGIINSDTTLVFSDDAKTVGGTIYAVVRLDPGSDFVHPHYLAIYTSDDDGETWTKLSDVEAVLDCNEAGLLHVGGDVFHVYVKDSLNLNTYRYVSTDACATWSARQFVTNQVGWMNKPRCKTLGGFYWLYGRDYRSTTRTVVYRSTDALVWEPRFYPFPDGFEGDDNGYCDLLLRDNGDGYLLSYAGSMTVASVTEAIFSD
jgi:hypothetical protein